jgi:hypothetical protein
MIDKKDIMSDLYDVGRKKSVGYLPLSTLADLNENIGEIIKYTRLNNLNYKIYNSGECDTSSGAIYVWCESMLAKILIDNQTVLAKAKIPFKYCIDYIDYIASKYVCSEKYPLAYIVVGKTFNDFRFR